MRKVVLASTFSKGGKGLKNSIPYINIICICQHSHNPNQVKF